MTLTAAQPSTTSALPDLTSALPDLTSALPDLTSALPELTSALPDLTSALPDLIGRVGAGDHDAFCALYAALAPTVLAVVQATLPEPGQAMNVSRATFVEVWWLSRHSGRHGHDITDVPTWILAIAARRANERRRTLDLANGSSFLAALRSDHDQHTRNQLRTLMIR